jgi:hypothetical protein
MMQQLTGMTAILVCLATAATAQVDTKAAQACFDQAVASQTDPADCIDAVQQTCMPDAQARPLVAALCFTKIRDDWSAAIGDTMQTFVTTADDTIATIARIETKFDLLSALIQCDRVEELSLAASDIPTDMIALQKEHCAATASALAFMRLHLRTGPNAESKIGTQNEGTLQ